jgi:hypothetical protein
MAPFDFFTRHKGYLIQRKSEWHDINLGTSLNLLTSGELFMTPGAYGRLRYPFLLPSNIWVQYCAFMQRDHKLRKIVSGLVYCRNSTQRKISKNIFFSERVLQSGLSLFRVNGSIPTPAFSYNFQQEENLSI